MGESLTLVHRSFVSPVVHQQVWRPHQFRMNPDAFDSTVRGFVPLHLVILPLLRIILITLIILIILMIIVPLLMRMNNMRYYGRSQATQIVSCDLHVLVMFINAVISFKQSTSIKPNSNLHDVFQEGAIVHLHQPQDGMDGGELEITL